MGNLGTRKKKTCRSEMGLSMFISYKVEGGVAIAAAGPEPHFDNY